MTRALSPSGGVSSPPYGAREIMVGRYPRVSLRFTLGY
jgi:hypothetical protein